MAFVAKGVIAGVDPSTVVFMGAEGLNMAVPLAGGLVVVVPIDAGVAVLRPAGKVTVDVFCDVLGTLLHAEITSASMVIRA